MKKKPVKKSTYQVRHYRKSTAGKKRFLRWILLAAVAGLFLVFFTGNRSLFKLFSLYQQKQKLVKQKQEIVRENKQLKKEIEKLKTDEDYLEKIAREKYNMKRENDDVYLIEPR